MGTSGSAGAGFLAWVEGQRRHQQGGEVSPHKTVALLWALSRVVEGRRRLGWEGFRVGVGELLGVVGRESKPEYPFWHLKADGLWWVEGVKGVEAGKKFVPRPALLEEAEAGFDNAVFEALSADSALRTRAVLLLEGQLPLEVRDEVRARLGLEGHATASGGAETLVETKRRSSTRAVVVRDAGLVRRVKEVHGDRCQFCGGVMETARGRYSEAAHVRGLGEPHNGPDVLGNLLCLCSTCHVYFDTFTRYVGEDDAIRDIWGQEHGRLRRHPEHVLGDEYLAYHRQACPVSG